MRILYIHAYLTRFNVWHGERGRELVQELRAAGAEVNTLPVVPGEDKPFAEDPDGFTRWIKRFLQEHLPTKWTMFIVEYYLPFRGITRTALWCWRVWRQRHQLCPDVVLARTFECEWTPWIVARILKRPLVLEIHAPFYIERQLRGRRNSKLLRWFERVQWRRAARLWVISQELKTIIAKNNVASDCIRIIPFGVRMKQIARREPHRTDDSIRVIFVGSFYRWHGIEILLKAFARARAQVSSLHLCLVGDGITRSANEREARVLGIEDSIEFTGWLSQEEVVEKLNKADIGVAPFLKLEPFYFEPVKVLDYMAAGLAIVASKQGPICELLEHGKCGTLVPPEDVPALADALVDLALNPDKRKALGQAARARIAEHYAWTTTARRVLSLCEDAAAGRA